MINGTLKVGNIKIEPLELLLWVRLI